MNYNKKTTSSDDFVSTAYYELGISCYEKGYYDKAINSYKHAIELKSDFADAYFNMGVAYHKKGNYDIAIENFQIAARLGNEKAQVWLSKYGILW